MTMREFTASLDAPAPRAAVFAHVDDPRHTTSYVEGLVRWEPRSRVRTHEVGTIIDATLDVAGGEREAIVVVSDRRPDEHILWVPEGGYRIGGGWVLSDGQHGTHVLFRLQIDVPGGVAGRLLAKALEPTVRSLVDRSLSRLAEQVSAQQ